MQGNGTETTTNITSPCHIHEEDGTLTPPPPFLCFNNPRVVDLPKWLLYRANKNTVPDKLLMGK